MDTQFNDTKFNLVISIVAIALAFLFGSLQAYAVEFGTEEGTNQDTYTQDFKALDTDHDGTLDSKEVRNDHLFKNKIKAADTDNDGTVDQKEYTEYRAQHEKKQMKRVISDSTITTKIKALLIKDVGLKSLKINVDTYKGQVILSGFVASEAQSQQAEKIAKSVEGVTSVKNSLVVKGGE